MNVAIDGHDEPCYGMDKRYLINTLCHRFRGTYRAYGFTSIESVKNSVRSALSVIRKDPLDCINNAIEIDLLLRHAESLGVAIGKVRMDRRGLAVSVMKKVEALSLEYTISAKDNSKFLGFKEMEVKHCDSGFLFLVVSNTVSSGIESIKAKFVHVIYYPDRKRHDFSFNTNANVTEGYSGELVETYRKRWILITDTWISRIRRRVHVLPKWFSGISSSSSRYCLTTCGCC